MPNTPRTWDLFCRLLDNFGDVGVSWRLAADLAARGELVRLWVDNLDPLRFMAPQGHPGVEVLNWPADDAATAWPEPGDVVVENFGCELPAGFVDAMTRRAKPPVWLNLEYLSAETYAERSHLLASPQRNGLPKWFFFPGFTLATGGLIREPGLLERREAFDRDAWLGSLGIQRHPHEQVALLFCYPNPALADTLQQLARQGPTLLLLTPGHAQSQAHALQAAGALPEALRLADLPWLTQAEFDHALWCADINFIRGEDTWVRAIWGGAPFVWQLYPQEAEVRDTKLRAWLQRLCGGTPLEAELLALHRHYNTLPAPGADTPAAAPAGIPDTATWRSALLHWRGQLTQQPDLVSQLQAFVNRKS
ncbi:MAG: elongation factor P maturation arginine rhamnosyltransferase EarP [Rubrivivax sp.]|jgi:uncharacterized repeat protein (TIGR03837 family)